MEKEVLKFEERNEENVDKRSDDDDKEDIQII